MRFAGDERGAVAVLAAFAVAILVGIGALAVDLGTAYVARRRQQTATDLAALAAAADLARARDAAVATLARNSGAGLVSLEAGTYVADAARGASDRFAPGGSAPNAVRLVVRGAAPRAFSRAFADGADTAALTTRATAARADFAAFAIGSRPARLEGGVLNGVLGAMLGANLALSVLDYRALAAVRIDLGRFATAAATRAGLSSPTYEGLAAATVRLADALGALGDVARADPRADPVALGALAAVGRATTRAADRVALKGVIDAGPVAKRGVEGGTPLPVAVSALDVLEALGQAPVRGGTVRAAIGAAVPGITAANVTLALGESASGTASAALGSPGASARTSQARLRLDVTLLGAPAVTLPIVLDVAAAKATLAALRCDAEGRPSATLEVQPGVVEGWVGAAEPRDIADFGARPNPIAAVLLDMPGLRVTGRAHALVGDTRATPVVYGAAEIAAGMVKTTTTSELSAALIAVLLRDLRVEVSALGLGIAVPGGLEATVIGQVAAAAPALDALLTGVLATLGLGIGQADTWVAAARCGGAVLVD